MNSSSIKDRRKIKKSFSISPESESFIRRTCKEHKSASESETLDMLLRELIAMHRQRAIEAAYTAYYDCLSEAEQTEQSAWAVFVESQLAEEVR